MSDAPRIWDFINYATNALVIVVMLYVKNEILKSEKETREWVDEHFVRKFR